MAIAVKAEALGKKYLIKHGPAAQYPTLRDEIAAGFRTVAAAVFHPRRALQNRAEGREEFWALAGVDFTIRQGERVGIIGRNGAGKTTVLKILSRITHPTTGKVSINGRLASLLEVGTGFHPELSGRENIFLNGAILGMGRAEIRRAFDEIVAFAEVERFLDTPVKRYSSGMYVRLAFSVAAHLEPEILVVDEVLAVGDLDFQRKCLGKMKDVGSEGRTVLFVSHNMHAIETLCDRALVLRGGEIAFDGAVARGVALYREEGSGGSDGEIQSTATDPAESLRVTSVELRNGAGESIDRIASREALEVHVTFDAARDYWNKEIEIGIGIEDEIGRRVFTAVSTWLDERVVSSSGTTKVVCEISHLPLVTGRYAVIVGLNYKNIAYDYVRPACTFALEGTNPGAAARTFEHGQVDVDYTFEVATRREP